MLSDFKAMQYVHYMNRIDIHVDMKKLTLQYKHLSNMWQSTFKGKEW